MSDKKELTTKQKVENALFRFRGAIESSEIDRRAIRLLEKMDKVDKEEVDKLKEKNSTLINQFVRMHEFDKHFLLAESIPSRFAAMSIKMTNTLIKENNCTTDTEKSLVEIIVLAFCRVMHLNRLHTVALGGESIPVESDYVNYYNFLSKELDKANRQYLTALTTLQQINSPPMKVNLKADMAVVAQNQQFNSIQEIKDENNKPK